MNNILGIIQARVSSERLPGKVLKDISGKPLLFHIIERLKRSKIIDRLVLATSTEPEDAVLRDVAQNCGIDFYRGSLNDVLDRFIQAGRMFSAKDIVRICGDNPLIDHEYLDTMICWHLRENADYTYCHSKIPTGTAGEVASLEGLEKINNKAQERAYREHVTTYFLECKEEFKVCSIIPPLYLLGKSFRLTVDTEKDLELMRAIYNKFYKENRIVELKEVIRFLEKNPEISGINRQIKQRDWRETA